MNLKFGFEITSQEILKMDAYFKVETFASRSFRENLNENQKIQPLLSEVYPHESFYLYKAVRRMSQWIQKIHEFLHKCKKSNQIISSHR